jgi:acyl dehydratase
MSERYLEDYAVGGKLGSGRIRVDKDRIKAFAAEFDPQPFHLDEAQASDEIFRGLAASGWHTAAMTIRLLVEGELKLAGGIVGTGLTSFDGRARSGPATRSISNAKYWKCGRQKSRTDQGLIKLRTTTLNQNNESVQIQVGNLPVPRRTAKND